MKARRIAHERPAFPRVGRVADRGPVAQRRDRQSEKLSEFDNLLDGAFGQPGSDAFADELAVLPPPDLKTELRNFGQLGAVDHRGEIQPLLAGDHGDPDVAVLGRFDRGHFDGA